METINQVSGEYFSPMKCKLITACKAAAEQPLLSILAIGFVLRAMAAVFFTGPIDLEGAEYARIAQNLVWGNGYAGIAEEGTQLFFPPLFPFAIAGVSLLTGDAEIAGRIISVVMGAVIVFPTYFIALKMYDRRTATLAAAFVGFHPFLIYMSTTVYCEMTYLTLILTAICLAFSTIEKPTWQNFGCAGVVYGLAYLVRPDGAACMLISATLISFTIFIKYGCSAFSTCARVGLMIGAFILVAAPYVIWVSGSTGHFRFEGKSPLNIATERRVQLGENISDAAFGVDLLGNERGIWNQPNLVIIQTQSLRFKELLTYTALKTRSVVKNASEAIANLFPFGSPPLFVFAVIGLFARPWALSLASYQLQIFGFMTLMVLSTYFIYYNDARFYVLLVPFYCIWGAVGLQRIVSWGMETGSAMGLPNRYRVGLSLFVLTAGLSMLFVTSIGVVGYKFADARANRPIKMAGEWLQATTVRPIRILDSATDISFHAKATHFWLPYCDETTALRYLERKNINIAVIRKSAAETRPYLKAWADNGIPHPRAKLAYSLEIGTHEKIMIYRIENTKAVLE